MKKLILMTSALTLVGGTAFAAAHGGGDISFTASAGVTAGNWDGASDNLTFDAGLTAALETGAAGLTVGAEVSVDGEVVMDSTGNTTDNSVGFDMLYVSGDFGKITFMPDEWDVVSDEVGDIQYTGSFGDVSVEAIHDFQGDEWLASLNYAGDGFNVGVETRSDELTTLSADVDLGGYTVGGSIDTDEAWDIFASTDFNGISVTGTYDSDEVFTLDLAGSAGSVDWAASADTNGIGSASLSTSFGDTSVSLSYDHEGGNDTGDDARTIARVEHAIGNVTLHAQVNDAGADGEYEVGASASFDF